MADGNYINSLPKFSIENYDIWKIRMKAHLNSYHDRMWEVITKGPITTFTTPNTAVTGAQRAVGGQEIPRPEDQWDDKQRKIANLDNITQNMLFHYIGDAQMGNIAQ
ncbi:hypothetical protein ACS0TY_014524 [Phlomoides rotata]